MYGNLGTRLQWFFEDHIISAGIRCNLGESTRS